MINRRKPLPERIGVQRKRHSGEANRIRTNRIPELIPKEDLNSNHELSWESNGEKRLSQGWFRLLWGFGSVFLLFLAVAIMLNLRGNKRPLTPPNQISSATAAELSTSLDAKIDRAHDTIIHFLRASTIEGKLPFVRDSDRVLPGMVNWYSSHEHVAQEVSRFEMMATTTIDLKPIWVSLVFVQSGPPVTLMLEDTPDGPKVDWEAFVGYNPLSLTAFVDQKRQAPTDFRVYATASDYFLPPFDESQHLALKLECRNENTFVYGYIKRSDQDAAEIFAATRAGPRKPLRLALRYPATAPNQDTQAVEIVSLIKNNWLGDKNAR